MGMSWEEKAKFSEAIDGSDQTVSMETERVRKAILEKRPQKVLGYVWPGWMAAYTRRTTMVSNIHITLHL